MENTIFSDALSASEITQIIVSKYRNNPVIKDIELADRYFDNHNEFIEKKTRTYYDKDRKPIPNPAASNSRIKSNFLRMLVQQKQDYGFAKTFVFKLYDEKNEEIDLKKDEYGQEWKRFLDRTLFKISYILAGQAVNHGIAWAYVWIDDNGDFQIKDVPANIVYPIWKNRQHTELDRLVYNFHVEIYDNLNPNIYEYAEYWSDEERRLFNMTKGYVEEPINFDNEGNPIASHLTNEQGGISWGQIPFLCLKATDDEKTLLSFIKEQIDAYDMLSSKSVDGLIDDLDPILVLKGISPAVADLIEARELAKMTRTIATDTDGDAGYIQSQTPIENHLKQMENLRRDIIKFAYGVDYEDAKFGGNPNQLLIRSAYQNLDTYTDGLERHFQNFIDNLKYFFDKWYEFSGRGAFDECQKYTALVELDRSMMINQSEQIDDTVKLANTGISQRTLLEFNPVVQDVDLELKRLKEDAEKAQENEDLFNDDLGNNKKEEKPE